jgi:hypothetical protein
MEERNKLFFKVVKDVMRFNNVNIFRIEMSIQLNDNDTLDMFRKVVFNVDDNFIIKKIMYIGKCLLGCGEKRVNSNDKLPLTLKDLFFDKDEIIVQETHYIVGGLFTVARWINNIGYYVKVISFHKYINVYYHINFSKNVYNLSISKNVSCCIENENDIIPAIEKVSNFERQNKVYDENTKLLFVKAIQETMKMKKMKYCCIFVTFFDEQMRKIRIGFLIDENFIIKDVKLIGNIINHVFIISGDSSSIKFEGFKFYDHEYKIGGKFEVNNTETKNGFIDDYVMYCDDKLIEEEKIMINGNDFKIEFHHKKVGEILVHIIDNEVVISNEYFRCNIVNEEDIRYAIDGCI